MGENSEIAWTDATFNPWIGCAKVSAGCTHCYASTDTFARRERANGRELWGVDAARHVTSDAYWKAPLKWNREAAAAGVRKRVFCASLSDVFENRQDLLVPRGRLCDLILQTPALDWLLLTKRPENIRTLWPIFALPENVWIGTTCEDQEAYDKRWPVLAKVAASVRFVSHEPGLGRLKIDSAGTGVVPDWVITGGESGPKARPYQVEFARSVIRQCRALGSAPFVKQLGACAVDEVNGIAGASLKVDSDGVALVSTRLRHPKGGDPAEWPPELRVQEFPKGQSR